MQDKTVNMKHELTIVIDKIENIRCRTHSEASEIKFVNGRIQINSCCKEHKELLKRKIEYEMYELLNQTKEEIETLPALKQAV
jgi:hypothetical protein